MHAIVHASPSLPDPRPCPKPCATPCCRSATCSSPPARSSLIALLLLRAGLLGARPDAAEEGGAGHRRRPGRLRRVRQALRRRCCKQHGIQVELRGTAGRGREPEAAARPGLGRRPRLRAGRRRPRVRERRRRRGGQRRPGVAGQPVLRAGVAVLPRGRRRSACCKAARSTRWPQLPGWKLNIGAPGSGVPNLMRKLLEANRIDPTALTLLQQAADAGGGGAARRRDRRAGVRLGARVADGADAAADAGRRGCSTSRRPRPTRAASRS